MNNTIARFVTFSLFFCLQSYAAVTVHFSQDEYQVIPGEILHLQIRMNSIPDSGIFSYGVKITFDGERAAIENESAILSGNKLDFQGVKGSGALKEAQPGYGGNQGDHRCFSTSGTTGYRCHSCHL